MKLLRSKSIIVGVTCFLILLACGKKKSGNCVVSATVASITTKVCAYYAELDSTQYETSKNACASSSVVTQTWTEGSTCDTTGSVGACALTSSGVAINYTYYSGGYTAATAQADCTQKSGTFTAS